ncbi:MAG: hypothetical protein KAR39_11650 [Thermoplasmata archaeon]|nr:hypothetical protein [Thermoplasmata archaeon]
MDEDVVREILMDWEYSPDNETLVYQTLFGCAQRFKEYSGIRSWLTLQDDVPATRAAYQI